mgnify:CR=1
MGKHSTPIKTSFCNFYFLSFVANVLDNKAADRATSLYLTTLPRAFAFFPFPQLNDGSFSDESTEISSK